MGVRLTVDGMLVQCEFRAEDGGSGFVNATVLPPGSRETFGVWSFGDGAAAVALMRAFQKTGVGTPVIVVADVGAKADKKGGGAYLSSRLLGFVDADGVLHEGRVASEPTRPTGFDDEPV